jgi:L-lysine 2,3-aminomutase
LLLKAIKFVDPTKINSLDEENDPNDIMNKFIAKAINKKLKQTNQKAPIDEKSPDTVEEILKKYPCNVIHKISYNADLMFAIFLIEYNNNTEHNS